MLLGMNTILFSCGLLEAGLLWKQKLTLLLAFVESAIYYTECSPRRELVSTSESTPRHLQCTLDTCCLSWYWPGDMFGGYR
jgi:hypothetical protein